MRFPSDPRFDSHASRFAVLAFALAVVAVGAGCEDKHIGRPCELGMPSDRRHRHRIATITSPALECPSRICLLPAPTRIRKGTGVPLCTAGCESNEDCEDGELGDTTDATDKRCKTGFVCMWPTTVGNFCCQKFCVCRDFVTEPTGWLPAARGLQVTQPADRLRQRALAARARSWLAADLETRRRRGRRRVIGRRARR